MANNDHISASDTLTFAAGDTTAYIPVTIVQDDIDELDETFTVTISGGVNATMQPPAAQRPSRMMMTHLRFGGWGKYYRNYG